MSKNIKLLGLNVCGLKSKLNSGILENYCKNYDFICLSETKVNPCINDVHVDGYELFCKRLGNNNAHTIGLLVKECYSDHVQVITDTISETVLWLYVNKNVIGCDFILGSVYIPHENSPGFNNDLFDQITQDAVNFSSRFNNAPLCLIGDFNSRTGICNDFFTDFSEELFGDEEKSLSKCDLESLGIDLTRYSQDSIVNNNGQKLIECCKLNDIHIVNGRFGQDSKVGQTTCKGVSVVDYVVASPGILSCINDFMIDEFDPLLSDVHSPVCLTLSNIVYSETTTSESSPQYEADMNVKHMNKVKWKSELCQEYNMSVNINDINKLKAEVENLSADSTTADTINAINDRINQILLSPADTLGMMPRNSTKRCANKRKCSKNPWFNNDCKKLRSEYLSIKRKFRMSVTCC